MIQADDAEEERDDYDDYGHLFFILPKVKNRFSSSASQINSLSLFPLALYYLFSLLSRPLKLTEKEKVKRIEGLRRIERQERMK